MLHAKFQDHRFSGSGGEVFYYIWTERPSWSVTWTININFHSPFPKRLNKIIGLLVLEEKIF